MKVEIPNAEETITKTVKPYGNGAMITVPKKWIGKTIKAILIKEEKQCTTKDGE